MPYRPAYNRQQLPQPTGYFVYCYLRTRTVTPYYIGLGSRPDRMTAKHAVKVPRDRSRIRIMREGLTKEEAVFWEVYYIAKIGRKDLATGPLLNRKEGGEGELVSDELRQQISEKVAALWAAGVFAAINSPEAIKRRSYNRQANKAAELKVDLDTYLGLDKCKRDQFVQWRKENPEADWKEFFDTRRSATAAARYQVPLEIWENLDAKQKNALKEYCNNIPGRSGMDWLAGVRAVGGPKPKVDPKQVRRLRDEGLTNTQIAKQLNCTQPTISRILSGKRQRARQALAA